MVESVELVLNRLENPSGLVDAAILGEQADELGLKQVLVVEAIFDDQREDLVELFHGSAELEKNGGWVPVDMRGDVGSF